MMRSYVNGTLHINKVKDQKPPKWWTTGVPTMANDGAQMNRLLILRLANSPPSISALDHLHHLALRCGLGDWHGRGVQKGS